MIDSFRQYAEEDTEVCRGSDSLKVTQWWSQDISGIIHSLTDYLLSTRHGPGVVLGAEDVSGNNHRAGLMETSEIPGRETDRERIDI